MPASRLVAALAIGTIAVAAATPARGQEDTSATTVAGDGAVTWVLVTGTVGGVAGFRRLAQLLLARGDRVLIVDPYRLSLDSADMSFAGLGRRVAAVMERHGAADAHVVAHAHGAGVALRLAAIAPERVGTLTFLDAGALDASGTTVLRASLRLVPVIARIPGGRSFLRDRFVRGLRDNAGRTAWLDGATVRSYTEPLLRDVDRVVVVALRIAGAREPEPIEDVVARVRAPLLIILGSTPRPAGPTPEEFVPLQAIGGRLRLERLAGVGHFVHEEAPEEVAALPPRPRVVAHVAGALR